MGDTVQKTCGTCQRTYAKAEDFLAGTSRWRQCSAESLWFNCGCGSTLVMRKGTYPWWNPALAMGPLAKSVFHRLADRDSIPHIPTVVMEVTELLQAEDLDVPKIALMLKREPVLSAFLLATANNLKHAGGKKITLIDHAIVFVGKKTLSELVQMAGLATFRARSTTFPVQRFWREAQLAGFATEQVARSYAPALGADHAYLAGSLANLGKLLGAIIMPETTDAIVAKQTSPRTVGNWLKLEHAERDIDHTVLGEIAATLWGLPDFIRDACASHHDMTKLFRKAPPKEPPTLMDVTAVGVQLAHWVELDAFQVETKILDAFRARVGIDVAELERFADELTKKSQSLASAGA